MAVCTRCNDTGQVPCPFCGDYSPGECPWCGGTGRDKCHTLACFVRDHRDLSVAEIVQLATAARYLYVTPQAVRRILRRGVA